ncbi:MAG: ABC transporter ATP-binding protein [Candidatus Adiutrix sp.]|jgi:ABC-2 type transport system ATP-binding protein|nr:ABC transporter ATP-binding protein [Candidatus Adiutrix sp.]
MNRASLEQTAKYFGDLVVFQDVSLELKRGGRYALLGPNGAGKSTLLRLLAGVLRPDRGRVLVDGREPWRDPARTRAGLGLLPEGAPLIADLTVREHLLLAAGLRGLSRTQRAAEEERLVDGLSLAAFYSRPAGLLSQGQRRRAALASALLGAPDFLILDEPGSGLDPEEAGRLAALLTALPPSVTLLLSSHILGELYELTEEVLVLAHGRLAAGGPWDRRPEGCRPGETALRRQYLALIGEARP